MRRLLALALVPLVLLAACGDDDDDDAVVGSAETTSSTAEDVPSSSGDLTEADCAVTTDEVGAAVGLPMVFDEVVDSGDGAWCTWKYADGLTTVGVDWYATTGAKAIENAGDAWSDLEDVSMMVQGADEAVASNENWGVVARRGEEAVRVFVEGPDIELDDPQGVGFVIAEVAFGLTTEGE